MLEDTYALAYDGNAIGDDDVSRVPSDDGLYLSGDVAVLDGGDGMSHSDVDGCAVELVGWSLTDTDAIYSAGESGDLPDLVDSVTFSDSDVTVYAVWGYDEDGNGIPDVLEEDTGMYKTYDDIFVRLWGDDRYDTMEAIARESYEGETTQYAVVATGDSFPDALAAASLAGALDAPILLTSSDDCTDAIESMEALGVSEFYIVGGTSAVSEEIEEQLVEETGATLVDRLGGETRYETALEIAEETLALCEEDSSTAIIATGSDFADSLTISPYSFKSKSPIYLASDGVLSDDALQAISEAGYTDVVIVGGTEVVYSDVETQLAGIGIGSDDITRLGGDDRSETTLTVALWCVEEQGMQYEKCGLATTNTFPDALTGGAFCGRNNAVVMLISDENAEAIGQMLAEANGETTLTRVYVFGGTEAVSAEAYDTMKAAFYEAIGVDMDDLLPAESTDDDAVEAADEAGTGTGIEAESDATSEAQSGAEDADSNLGSGDDAADDGAADDEAVELEVEAENDEAVQAE